MRHTQVYTNDDGSQLKLVAELFFGSGLHKSYSYYGLIRKSDLEQWSLVSGSNIIKSEVMKMSRDEYMQKHRCPIISTIGIGQILKAYNVLRLQYEDALIQMHNYSTSINSS